MAQQRMVKLVNMVNKQVGVTRPEFGIRRRWKIKGQPQYIPFDVMEQLLWDEAFMRMIERGILYIEDMQDKIDLGLEPVGATGPTNIRVLNDSQIITLLKVRSYDEFVKEVEELPIDQIRNIANYAIHNELAPIDKCNYLKKKVDVDVLKAITLNRDLAEAEEREAQRQAEIRKRDKE